MNTEVITIHGMDTNDGRRIEYARIIRKRGNVILGQSVLLSRLSAEQLRNARRAAQAMQKDGPESRGWLS